MFTSFLSRKPEMLWKHYSVAFTLLLAIVLASHILEFQALKSARKDAELINISGKQRMLSQQIVLFAHDYSDPQSRQGHSRQTFLQTLETFTQAHAYLLEEARGKPGILAIYQDADAAANTLIQAFIDLAVSIANTSRPSQMDLETLYALGTGPVIEQLDAAVSGFEAWAKRRSQRLHMLQILTLIVAVFVVLLEAAFIFLPAQRIVYRSIHRMRSEIKDHEITNHRLSNFVNIAADFYWETDLKCRITYIEGRFLETIQAVSGDLSECKLQNLFAFDRDQSELFKAALEEPKKCSDVRANFRDVDGNAYVISLSGQPRYDPQGHITGYLGTGDDITADINILGEVTRLSLTDPLTNVANKRAFERDLKSALEIADKANPVYLMALDLDDFKPINDTYGHSAGDKVIQIIAQRIQSQLRSDAFLARTGGDEFCIVCTLGKSQTHIQPLAQRIRQTVLQPIRLSKTVQVQVGVSIGIAMAPLIGASPEQLICAADRALYEAKREGRQLIRIAASGPERADGSNLPREGHGMVSPESVARPAAHMMG